MDYRQSQGAYTGVENALGIVVLSSGLDFCTSYCMSLSRSRLIKQLNVERYMSRACFITFSRLGTGRSERFCSYVFVLPSLFGIFLILD